MPKSARDVPPRAAQIATSSCYDYYIKKRPQVKGKTCGRYIDCQVNQISAILFHFNILC